MDANRPDTDRRKEKRYKVASGAYAVVGHRPNKLGQIDNISSRGLAFKYLADQAQPDGAQVMDIFVRNQSFRMKGIPIRTIYDVELARENPLSTVVIRQQSVLFGDLTDEQESKLKQLLQYHTLGET